MPEMGTSPRRPIGWLDDDARSPVCADRVVEIADHEPAAEGVDSAETPSRRRTVEAVEKRRVGAADGDRERVHLAALGQIESPPR